MDWQPIATAPRDGAEFDIWIRQSDGTGVRVTNCFFLENGRISGPEDFFLQFYREGAEATHWMPIPEPPKEGN